MYVYAESRRHSQASHGQHAPVGEMLPCAGYNNNDGSTASGSNNNNKNITKKLQQQTAKAIVATWITMPLVAIKWV